MARRQAGKPQAVSYTHLDVYKRQVEACIAELRAGDPAILAGWERQRQRIEAAAAFYKRSPDFVRQGKGDTATHKLFVERSYMPVSYTHLDVYKRQP